MVEARNLAKLTEREKECLRAWLDHRTAKEIALDLGISHYAVEKRLKTARLKLGVGSSLEAARRLASEEGYGLAVAHAPDLSPGPSRRQPWFTDPLIMGAMAMSVLAAVVLAVTAQSGSVAPDRPAAKARADNSDIPQTLMAVASPEQVEAFVRERFADFDKDRSGRIERTEGPSAIPLGCCAHDPRNTLTGAAAWQHFLKQHGDDGDGQLSFAEFRGARFDRYLKGGIPIDRSKVVVVGERASPYAEKPVDGRQKVLVSDMQHVKVSEERVRAYVRTMFDAWDKDGSGFVELAEAPDRLGTPKATMAADGTVTYDRGDPLLELTGDAARAQYIENVDRDGDARVSFEEYARPVMPQYLQRGIPLIPADWAGGGSKAKTKS